MRVLSGRYSLPCRTIRQVGRLSGTTRDPARPGAQGLDKQSPARSVDICKDTSAPVPSSVPNGTIPCRIAHFVLGRAVVSVRQQLPTSCSCYLTPPALASRYFVPASPPPRSGYASTACVRLAIPASRPGQSAGKVRLRLEYVGLAIRPLAWVLQMLRGFPSSSRSPSVSFRLPPPIRSAIKRLPHTAGGPTPRSTAATLFLWSSRTACR